MIILHSIKISAKLGWLHFTPKSKQDDEHGTKFRKLVNIIVRHVTKIQKWAGNVSECQCGRKNKNLFQ